MQKIKNMKEKSTLVLGATPKSNRYAYKATQELANHGIKVYPVGIRKGEISGIEIITDRPEIKDVHTVTLYVGPERQVDWYNYILDTIAPKRIVFNPGTENQELKKMAEERGIFTEEICTLVALSLDSY